VRTLKDLEKSDPESISNFSIVLIHLFGKCGKI
jgi:hypothetical protein